MRSRTIVLMLSLCVLAVLALAPAHAARSGRKAVPTTLYFHGESPSGELDSAPGLVDLVSFMRMDTDEPTGSEPRSKGYVWSNYLCAGNRLHPVWVGDVTGRIVGDLKMTFTNVSAPQEVDIRIWNDVYAQLCNADYQDPAATVTVAIPAGQSVVEVTIPNVSFITQGRLMVQISPTNVVTDVPGLGRVLYDSVDADSRIEFSCIPKKGATCTP